MSAGACVYRVYDAEDRLIYVGASSNLRQRLAYHSGQAWWWSLADRVTHQDCDDMDAAYAAEAEAIRAESPAFNITRGRGRPPTKPKELSDADTQVCRDWLAAKPHGSLPLALRWVAQAA